MQIGEYLLVAGQIALIPNTLKLLDRGIHQQLRLVENNITAISDVSSTAGADATSRMVLVLTYCTQAEAVGDVDSAVKEWSADDEKVDTGRCITFFY